jgi:hypothetical protein
MSGWVILSINLVLLFVCLLVFRRYVDRRTSQQNALDEVKQEVGAIITELNQTTERNIELVEDRMRRLRELMDGADKRLGALRRHAESDKAADLTYSRLRDQVPLVQHQDEEATSAPETESVTQAPVEPKAEPAAEPVPDGQSGQPEEVPLRERVKSLYLRGLAPERIAVITGRTVGEVELMISLEER